MAKSQAGGIVHNSIVSSKYIWWYFHAAYRALIKSWGSYLWVASNISYFTLSKIVSLSQIDKSDWTLVWNYSSKLFILKLLIGWVVSRIMYFYSLFHHQEATSVGGHSVRCYQKRTDDKSVISTSSQLMVLAPKKCTNYRAVLKLQLKGTQKITENMIY